ncbi:MAG: PepSY-like domain-containing protein [Pseudomonadota bacterium]
MTEIVSEDQVPGSVKDALEKKFPGSVADAWTYTAEFEADLTIDGREVEITFDQHGQILQIEREIDPSTLPQAIKDTLARDFPTATIDEAETVEIPDGDLEFFEVELDEDGESVEVHICADGTFLDIDEDL